MPNDTLAAHAPLLLRRQILVVLEAAVRCLHHTTPGRAPSGGDQRVARYREVPWNDSHPKMFSSWHRSHRSLSTGHRGCSIRSQKPKEIYITRGTEVCG